jgi:hypothetical protein
VGLCLKLVVDFLLSSHDANCVVLQFMVMPYLGCRAIKNKSVLGMGSASEELSWAWAGIKKSFGWIA